MHRGGGGALLLVMSSSVGGNGWRCCEWGSLKEVPSGSRIDKGRCYVSQLKLCLPEAGDFPGLVRSCLCCLPFPSTCLQTPGQGMVLLTSCSPTGWMRGWLRRGALSALLGFPPRMQGGRRGGLRGKEGCQNYGRGERNQVDFGWEELRK